METFVTIIMVVALCFINLNFAGNYLFLCYSCSNSISYHSYYLVFDTSFLLLRVSDLKTGR